MLLIEGVVLGHHVSYEGIKFDPAKIEVIIRLPPPKTQKEVEAFLDMLDITIGLLRILQRLLHLCFDY
jgi:hypothetical protein